MKQLAAIYQIKDLSKFLTCHHLVQQPEMIKDNYNTFKVR